MLDLLDKYMEKMITDRSANPGRIAIAVKDDTLQSEGNQELSSLAAKVLGRLNALSLVVAQPSLPFSDFLVARSDQADNCIVPLDTETRTFLHDIPFVRSKELPEEPDELLAGLLGNRKGIIVEGVGIMAVGAVTVEQAYINYSSVFHSTFVKYLQDILRTGFSLELEKDAMESFAKEWLTPVSMEGLIFRQGPLLDPETILSELAVVGRYTVERKLVDSFFGNISCRSGEIIYISQTAASLDSLEGCIDPVPFDNSSTVGITASSELAAHRRIYETSTASVILHGHPKIAVVMSMICEEQHCPIKDCWKDCPHVRYLGDTPVVAGEIGAGGLAKRVPPVIAEPGKAVVYGHGVFTIGRTDFSEAFQSLVDVENWCRKEYLNCLERHGLINS